MKIKKSELIKIIQEEALKIKSLKSLYEQRNLVLKQLNELYQEENVEEWFGAGKSKEEKTAERLKDFQNKLAASKNPKSVSLFSTMFKSDPDKALKRLDLYINNVAKNPNKISLFLQSLEEDPEKAKALLDFYAEVGTVTTPYWNPEKKKWQEKAVVLGATHGAGPSAPYREGEEKNN